MAKSQPVPAGSPSTQAMTWRVRIGRFRSVMEIRSTALANLALGAGAAMAAVGLSLLVRTASEARRRRIGR